MNKAEELIACLEGEIAKRDETIARLEPQLIRAIQANYDMRAELSACRVAVENCDLFRARIAELEARIVWLECEAQVNAAPVSEAKAQGEYGDAYQGAREDLAIWKRRALEAEKALQEERIITERLGNALNEENGPTFMGEPVFPAKAQGVVQWPDADEIMQMAFEEGQPADDASGYCFELEEFDLFIERLMSEVARLNAATAAPAADACKACKGTGRRPIGGRGKIFGLTNRCFECHPVTAAEFYGVGDDQ